MHNRLETGMRLATAALLAGLIAGTAASASAATRSLAPGWQALVGCWEPTATVRDAAPDSTRGHLVCIVPVDGASAVDMVTVVDGKVVERERVDASGVRQPLNRDDCSGWQTAEWSATGARLHLRSELTCEGGLKRTSSGVISMPSSTEWVDVQSVAVGERKAVRALRYREARPSVAIPVEVSAALAAKPFATSTARLAAAAPVSAADLVDVSRKLDAAAVEVWLVEQKLAFTADAKQIVQLADAKVPASVIDVVVALSYPEKFTVATDAPGAPAARDAGLYGTPNMVGGLGIGAFDPFWDPYYGSRYNRRYYSPYGYSQYGYGYGYGSGWYPSTRPIVIVVSPPAAEPGTPAPAQRDGRVVKGRGYTRTPAPATSNRPASSSTGSSSGSSSSGSSAGSSSSGGSSGESSGSSTGRTAKKRPPAGSN